MIPALGVMIGAYIFTRMLEMILAKDNGVALKVFAVLTILITLVSVVDIMNAGTRGLR